MTASLVYAATLRGQLVLLYDIVVLIDAQESLLNNDLNCIYTHTAVSQAKSRKTSRWWDDEDKEWNPCASIRKLKPQPYRFP